MSFGFSVGDFITIGQLAWSVYKSCRDAPDSFNNISMEVLSLHAVLKEVEEMILEQELAPTKQNSLAVITQGCDAVLKDLQALVVKYESLGSKSKRTWDRMKWGANDIAELRARLTSNTILLTAFMSTSQLVVEKKLNNLMKEFQDGKHEGSVMTAVTVDTLAYDDRQTWRAIRKELEDIGITVAAFESNKGFILEWFQKAVENGAFEEKCGDDLDSIQSEDEDFSGSIRSAGSVHSGDFCDTGTPSSGSHQQAGGNPAPLELSPAQADIKAAAGPPKESRSQTAPRPGQYPRKPQPKDLLPKKTPRVVSLLAWALRYNNSFWEACSVGDFENAAKYLTKGAEVDTKYSGWTPLMSAVQRNDVRTAGWLLNRGADPNTRTNGGTPALIVSFLEKENIEMFQLLIDMGADVNLQTIHEQTALYLASREGNEQIVARLLTSGADIDKVNGIYFYSALDVAARHGHTAVVGILLDHGAATRYAEGTIRQALEEYYDETALLFIERVNWVRGFKLERSGNTLLHLAALHNCPGSVEALLKKGESPDSKNSDGFTPYDLTHQRSIQDIIRSYMK